MLKSRRVLIVLLLVIAMITGCAQPTSQPAGEPAALPSDTAAPPPTAELATATVSAATIPPATVPLAPSPTAPATPIPPTAAPATLPPAPAAPTVQPVTFPAGVSTLAVQSELPAGSVDTYALRILAGQMLLLNAPNQQGQVALGVRGADGGVLLSEQAGVSVWNGEITATQDYYVTVKSLAGAPLSYMMQITIPPQPPTPQPATPQPATPQPPQVQQVIFPAGADRIVLQGAPMPQASDRYVLRALAGQSMTINLPAQQGSLLVNIWGADGAPLLSEAVVANWTGALPKTQDYFIDIRNVGASKVAYLLTVIIPPLPATSEPEPRRITFAAGGTSATLQGALQPDGVDRYVLRVAGGQTLNVNVPGMAGRVNLIISGADGTVLASGGAGTNTWSGPVPITQDYFISVRSISATALNYTMIVQVPPLSSGEPQPKRITFAAGAEGATVYGSLAAQTSERWVLGVRAGQTINAVATASQGVVGLSIWGADGSVLLSDHSDSTTFSVVAPITQDYFIRVRAAPGGPAVYMLKVQIPAL